MSDAAFTSGGRGTGNLFRVAEKGADRLQAVEFQTTYDGVDIRIATPYRLDEFDWKVYVAVCALAGMDGATFDRHLAGSSSSIEPELWQDFELSGDALNEKAVRIRVRAGQLLREIGYTDSGKNRTMLYASLDRLGWVNKRLSKGSKVISGGGVLSSARDEITNELVIALSPLIARVFTGGGHHVQIDMDTVRTLKRPVALILHSILSARIKPGAAEEARYSIDTLVAMSHGPASTENNLRQRRYATRQALDELSAYKDWRIIQGDGRGGESLVSIWRRTSPNAVIGFRSITHREMLSGRDATTT